MSTSMQQIKTEKFDPEFAKDLRLYTVTINSPTYNLTSAEEKLIIDTFTEKIRKARGDVIQVNHKTFLSTGPDAIPDPSANVVLLTFEGEGRPDGLKIFERIVAHGEESGSSSVRWVRAKRVVKGISGPGAPGPGIPGTGAVLLTGGFQASSYLQSSLSAAFGQATATNGPVQTVPQGGTTTIPERKRKQFVFGQGGGEDLAYEDVDAEVNVDGIRNRALNRVDNDKSQEPKNSSGSDSDSDASDEEDLRTHVASVLWNDVSQVYDSGHDLLTSLVVEAGLHTPLAMECVEALIKHESAKGNQAAVVHGDGYFPAKADATIQDVELRFGVNKTLLLSQTGNVVLRSKACHKLFFPATSLASFMESHVGASAAKKTVASKQLLTSLFHGVSVKISGGYLSGTTRTINDFSLTTPEQQMVPAGDKHLQLSEVYKLKNITSTHSTLPCVNVGSAKRPFFVAAELCSILSYQLFKHTTSPTFQREVASALKLHAANVTFKEPEPKRKRSNTLITSSVSSALHVHYHPPMGKNWENSTMKLAKVILVEVRTVPFKQQSWKDFQTVFRQMAERHRDGRQPIAKLAEEVLRLPYNAGGEMQKQWIAQLTPVVNKLASIMSTVAVVFAMQNNSDQADIFAKMKKICDGLGIQCIGVNLATLAKKINTEKSAGLVKYCGQIYRKMFARTPVPDAVLSNKGRLEDLAVAIHTSEFEVRVEGQPQKTLYMVAMVSRELGASRMYRSSVKLVTASEGKTLGDALGPILKELLADMDVGRKGGKARSPKQLLVLRSGLDAPVTREQANGTLSMIFGATNGADWSTHTKLLSVNENNMTDISDVRKRAKTEIQTHHMQNAAKNELPDKAVFFIDAEGVVDEARRGRTILFGTPGQGTPTSLTVFPEATIDTGATKATAKADVAALCELFHDDHIGLFESKRPVPTHLAKRLTQWTKKHMVGEKMPEKCQGVQKDLWYL